MVTRPLPLARAGVESSPPEQDAPTSNGRRTEAPKPTLRRIRMASERIGLIAASFGKISTLVEYNHRKRESPLRVPQTQSAFHPHVRFGASVTRPNSPRTRVSPFAVPRMQLTVHQRAR